MPRRNQAIPNHVRASSELPEHSAIGSRDFEQIARESLRVTCHRQLLSLLQGEVQRSVPHQILVAAWGNRAGGRMQYDLVSAIPCVRTDNVTHQDLGPLIGSLFSKWAENETTPIGARFDDGLRLGSRAGEREELKAFQTMRSALIHGIRDARGEQDCLYAFLSADPVISRSALENLRVLLPFVDAASRRVAHLPSQTTESPLHVAREATTGLGLSARELEIMHWVNLGKTNSEIGLILNISTFTVKNHVQRILCKLDVANRAQAISRLQHHPQSRTVAQ